MAVPPPASASYSARVAAIRATVVPIGTVSPAPISRCTNPALSASTSAFVFSVSSSSTTCPAATSCPSSTSHCASRMSSVYAPSLGMITGVAVA